MHIRPATDEDLADIGRIFDRSVAWLTEQYRPDQLGRPPPGDETRELLYRHLLETGGMFIAEDPDPVGFSAAIVRDGVWFLSLLWVLPENHGVGIGSGLLGEALAWGRAAKTFSVVARSWPVAPWGTPAGTSPAAARSADLTAATGSRAPAATISAMSLPHPGLP